MHAWKFLITLLVLALIGCDQTVQQSALPIIEPADAISDLALAQQASDIENLSIEGTNAINFSGMVNGYRTAFDTSPIKWEPKLFRVAEARALALASNEACLRQAAQGAESATSSCGGLEQLKQYAQANNYAFKNILEASYVSIDQPYDDEAAPKAWSAAGPYKQIFTDTKVNEIGSAIVRSGNAIIYVTVLANE